MQKDMFIKNIKPNDNWAIKILKTCQNKQHRM